MVQWFSCLPIALLQPCCSCVYIAVGVHTLLHACSPVASVQWAHSGCVATQPWRYMLLSQTACRHQRDAACFPDGSCGARCYQGSRHLAHLARCLEYVLWCCSCRCICLCGCSRPVVGPAASCDLGCGCCYAASPLLYLWQARHRALAFLCGCLPLLHCSFLHPGVNKHSPRQWNLPMTHGAGAAGSPTAHEFVRVEHMESTLCRAHEALKGQAKLSSVCRTH